jgi:hypothetical protein
MDRDFQEYRKIANQLHVQGIFCPAVNHYSHRALVPLDSIHTGPYATSMLANNDDWGRL